MPSCQFHETDVTGRGGRNGRNARLLLEHLRHLRRHALRPPPVRWPLAFLVFDEVVLLVLLVVADLPLALDRRLRVGPLGA